MEKLTMTERAAYALGVMLCIIGDAIHDTWKWLECPAPDMPRSAEDPSSVSDKAVAALGIVAIALTIVSLTSLWIFQA